MTCTACTATTGTVEHYSISRSGGGGGGVWERLPFENDNDVCSIRGVIFRHLVSISAFQDRIPFFSPQSFDEACSPLKKYDIAKEHLCRFSYGSTPTHPNPSVIMYL